MFKSVDAKEALARLSGTGLDRIIDIETDSLITEMFPYGEEREIATTARVGQYFFRGAVLSAYHRKCCVTGISEEKLLIASHIKPWRVSGTKTERTKKQNGEITDETITTLNVVYKRALNGGLSRGLRNNSDVKKLQENLNRLNYNCGNPDGTFGLSTEVAVKKFQVDHGLTKDGVVGKTTLNAIVDSGPKTISEKGFKLLSDIEVPAGAKKDKNGKIISIPIVDVGDDKYTVGMGNAVDKNDTKTIAEYKRKYGVDVTKVGAQVDYDTCLRIFNDHIEKFTGTLDRMLKRNGYVPTQNEYDAMVIAVYNRPALANPGNALDTLIKNNSHNREEWRTTILNEYKGLDLWNSKGRGWTNRINEEIELFFDGDYTKNY